MSILEVLERTLHLLTLYLVEDIRFKFVTHDELPWPGWVIFGGLLLDLFIITLSQVINHG